LGAEFLKNLDFDIRNEIDELCSLNNPEDFFNDDNNESNFYGIYAHGAYLRIIQLVKAPDFLNNLPKTSFKMGENEINPSKNNTYKIILIKLSYFCLYCLSHLESEDEYFSDALANPMKKPEYSEELDKELIRIYLVISHSALVVSACKWIANFSKDDLPYQLRLIFIQPLLTYTTTILGYNSDDPILDWGVKSLRLICAHSLDQTKKYFPNEISESISHNENSFNRRRFLKIANGDEKIREKFGAKIYIEFEKQIAKIFDAFGFFVSPTSIGKRRADIIVATQKPNAYTFLVDAKSCKGNYSLPTTDSRAIKEYILTQKESLDIMPPLKFFLIISSSPSKTLESKLKKLSNEVGLPIKFVSALDLCDIIESSNWSIYSQSFLTSIVESGPILDKNWGKGLVQSIKQKKKAFAKYTELLQ
jgi:hypothetical protein